MNNTLGTFCQTSDFGQPNEESETVKLDSAQERVRLLDNLSEFVIRGTEKSGLIILFEDIQWLDEMSIRLMEFIARKASVNKAKLMIVGTFREEEGSPELRESIKKMKEENWAEERRLNPISKNAQEELINTMFGKEGRKLYERIIDLENSGNPLFLEEMLKSWVESGILTRKEWGWEIDSERYEEILLPENVEELIDRRLRGLSEKNRSWLEGLTAWGGVWSESEPQRILNLDERCSWTLVKKGLIREEVSEDKGKVYRFAQNCIREKIRNDISENNWRELNRKMLKWLEGEIENDARSIENEIERLARFAWEGREVDAYIKYGEDAGKYCEARFANSKALKIYNRILEFKTDTNKKTKLMEKVGDLNFSVGNLDAASENYNSAIDEIKKNIAPKVEKEERKLEREKYEVLSDEESIQTLKDVYLTLERLKKKLGDIEMRRGNKEKALKIYDEALEELYKEGVIRKFNSLEDSSILLRKVYIKAEFEADIEEAKRLCNSARSIAEKFGERGQEMIAEVERYLAILETRGNSFEKALSHCEKALKLYKNEPSKIAGIFGNIGVINYNQGKLDKALEFYEKSKKISEKIGNRIAVAIAFLNMGKVFVGKGDTEHASDCYEKVMKISGEIGDKVYMMRSLQSLSYIYSIKGELDEALKMYERARSIATEIGHKEVIIGTTMRIGDLYLIKGDLLSAQEYYEDSFETARKTYKHGHRLLANSLMCLGNIHQLKGALDDALDYFKESLNVSKKLNDRHSTLHSYLDIGSVYQDKGDFDRASDCFDNASKIANELENRSDIASVILKQGKLQGDKGNVDRALKLIEAAFQIASEEQDNVKLADLKEELGKLNCQKRRLREGFKFGVESVKMFQEMNMKISEAQARLTLAETLIKILKSEECVDEIPEIFEYQEAVDLKSLKNLEDTKFSTLSPPLKIALYEVETVRNILNECPGFERWEIVDKVQEKIYKFQSSNYK